jgi:hypothetical protein
LRITAWNDALFWLTLEGNEGKIDAQIWISTLGPPQSRVEQLNVEWSGRLKSLFQ